MSVLYIKKILTFKSTKDRKTSVYLKSTKDLYLIRPLRFLVILSKLPKEKKQMCHVVDSAACLCVALNALSVVYFELISQAPPRSQKYLLNIKPQAKNSLYQARH